MHDLPESEDERMTASSECPECGKPEAWVTKFNGGNPRRYLIPSCDCGAVKTVDRFMERLRRRDENGSNVPS